MLLDILQRALPRARRRARLRDRGRATSTSWATPTCSSAPTASTASSRRTLRATSSSRALAPGSARIHLVRHRPPLDAFTFIFQRERARPLPGPRLPLRARDAAPSSSSAPRIPGGAPGWIRRARPRASPTASGSSPTELRGHRLLSNRSLWISFATLQHAHAGTSATSCCSATPPTPRTSRLARARSWRWRTRLRWPTPSRQYPATWSAR